MDSDGKKQYVTPQAFFAYITTHKGKAEYYNGTIVDMAGGSPTHALIAANAIRAIGNGIDGSDCFVYTGDLMIEVETANSYLLPDLAVVCGKTENSKEIPGAVRNPKLLMEVLSDSTRNLAKASSGFIIVCCLGSRSSSRWSKPNPWCFCILSMTLANGCRLPTVTFRTSFPSNRLEFPFPSSRFLLASNSNRRVFQSKTSRLLLL
jgi:hypothetical protein